MRNRIRTRRAREEGKKMTREGGGQDRNHGKFVILRIVHDIIVRL